MSIVDPLGGAARQHVQARLEEAERVRLVRSIQHGHPRNSRRSAASVLRHLADRIEPASACTDC